MKKIFFVFIVLLVFSLLYCFFPRPPLQKDGKISVVVSGYVPYTLARQIGGDKIALSMLLPANAEPHSFEPAPGDMVAVRRADVFVYVSPRLEPWAKDVLSASGPETLAVEAAAFAVPSEDPHVWMDFNNAGKIAAALAGALSEKDPQNQAFYRQNLDAFQTELAALDADYQRALADCRTREVVHIGHLAFKNLAQRYHLSLSALAGSSHDGEHSARKLADLVKFIRQKNVKTIFTEETLSPRLSASVAEETGAQILPLYTVEHVSKEDFARGVTYIELMRRNLESLKRGLECKA
ncbi:MAG: metal ABC transporter substrate-binding protein [Candidatus Avelusimicrobium sp.]